MTPAATIAAKMEINGEGKFCSVGKMIEFRTNDGRLFASWSTDTPKSAEQQIRLFRASLKYINV